MFGNIFGSQPSPQSKVNETVEARKIGLISPMLFVTYIDAKIVGELCHPHLVEQLSAERISRLQEYEASMQCYAEKSLTNLAQPLFVKWGMPLTKAKQMTDQFSSAYPDRLARAKSEFEKMDSTKVKAICNDLVVNHKFSDYVFAEKLDAVEYQFGRLGGVKPVFNSYMASVASCPKLFSLENSVPAPAFLK